jgi:hypothetical protein
MSQSQAQDQGRGFYIGIDPGATGAACALPVDQSKDGIFVHDYKGPRDALHFIASINRIGPVVFAVLEDVNQLRMPPRGAARMEPLIRSAAYWRMLLICFGLDFAEIPPKQWQAEMLNPLLKSRDKKAASLGSAREAFPVLGDMLKRKKDHNRAEAALLAGYARRLFDLKQRRAQ